jgi:hypothetical protein
MMEMIEDRKGSTVLEERRDLLTNLIHASMENSGPGKGSEFTHRDLLGNIFVFLFAGRLFHFRYLRSSIELWSRSRNYSKCFIVCHSSSGHTPRGAGRTL